MNKLKELFSSKAVKMGGYSVITGTIVIAIVIAINVLVSALPATMTQKDMTSNELFSISEQTEQILGNLNDDINIYWIVQSGNEDNTIELLLNRYKSMSSKINVLKRDPDVYPTFAQSYGITSLQNNSFVVECGSRYRYVSYDEIYEYDYSNYYTTGSYDSSFAGESAFTSAINYVVSDNLPKVYTLSGHGEAEMSSNFSEAVSKENIETESLSLITSEAVPDDADLLIIYAPQSDISDNEKEMIETYLAGGGNLFLINSPPQDTNFTNIYSIMEHYGVTANDGIIIENSQSNYAFGMPYYLLPDIQSHTITSPLIDDGYYILLPLASGLSISENLPENITVTSLLNTSSSAFSKSAGYNMQTYEYEDGDIMGSFSLGTAIEDGNTGSKIIWISSEALLDDQSNGMVSGGNQDLFLNSLGWICEKQETISIHAKSLSNEYLTMTSGQSAMMKFMMLALIPIVYLAVGIIISVRRKRR